MPRQQIQANLRGAGFYVCKLKKLSNEDKEDANAGDSDADSDDVDASDDGDDSAPDAPALANGSAPLPNGKAALANGKGPSRHKQREPRKAEQHAGELSARAERFQDCMFAPCTRCRAAQSHRCDTCNML